MHRDTLEGRAPIPRYSRFFALCPELLCIAGFDGFLKDVNPAWEKALGFTRGELLGRPYLEFVCADDRAATLAALASLQQGGQVERLRNRVICMDGAFKWLSWDAVSAPEERLIYAAARDISALIAAEAQARLKSDMVSLISHEYGNSLTNIRLALHLLQSTDTLTEVESRRHSYEVLDRTIEHLRISTDNFLSLNRLESGRFFLNVRPTSIRSVALETLLLLRPMAEAKRLQLELQSELPEDRPVPVLADSEALSIIINNLLNNAIKYTLAGGQVTVHIALDEKDSGAVRFCVRDTGIGICEADQRRILDGYYRTEESRSVAKGFGVGLMLVKELLERLGSKLELESAPGKGSRFSFRLPIAPAA